LVVLDTFHFIILDCALAGQAVRSPFFGAALSGHLRHPLAWEMVG